MRTVGIEIQEAASHPEGGYAVIVLVGLTGLPDGATFRLKPVDAKGQQETDDDRSWPGGSHLPRAVRRTDAGIELLIGPEIVECPGLVPGTLGVIEVPAAKLRGEFLWPSIKPTARPRRRHLSIVKPQPKEPAKDTARAAPTQPSETPRSAPLAATAEPASQPANGTDGLATLTPQRRAGAAASHITSDPAAGDEARLVPVTALDHATPATATIEQAIGAKVVQLDVQRERGGGRTAGDAGTRNRPGAEDAGDDAMWRSAGVRRGKAVRIGGLVAACALVGLTVLLLARELKWLADRSGSVARERVAQTRPVPPVAVDVDLVQRVAPRPAEPVTQVGAAETTQPGAPSQSTESTARDRDGGPGSGQTGATPQLAAPSEAPASSPVLPAALPPPAPQEVVLRMRGGGFQIGGELKGFDGTKYVIETRAAGVLTLDASRFECIGDGCLRPAAAILPLSERPSPVKPDLVRIEGSAALAAEYLPRLIREYAASLGATVAETPRDGSGARFRLADQRGVELATIEVAHTGTATALASLERGAAAIALVDRPNEQAEPSQRRPRPGVRAKQAQQQAPQQPTEILVGFDGVAAVAAAGSATASMSLDLLARVIAGQVTDWFEIGLPPGPITLYLPPEGSGTMEVVHRSLLRPRGLDASRSARRMAGDAEAAEAVVRDPRGIAMVALAAQGAARAIALETSCGLVVRPTSFGVRTGEYPLSRRLTLQLPPALAQPSARGLVRVAQSGEAAAAVAAARLVDQSIASLPIEEQSERMAYAVNAPSAAFDMAELRQLLADLDSATRLSVTFRFIAGTNDLDQASRRDLAKLAAVLKGPELAGQRILLAGFTDAGGRFQANLGISAKRAAQIRSSLLAAAGPGIDGRLVVAKGYGPLAPVACNGTPDGQRLNRRVEVWVGGGAVNPLR